jgi:hypothetical protein
MENVTLLLGSISIIDKIDMDYGLMSGIFGKAADQPGTGINMQL